VENFGVLTSLGINRLVKTNMKQLTRSTKLILGAVACTLATGCLPIPHTTLRSDEINGRVLDVHSHTPIQGAEIFLTSHTNIFCRTDDRGNFRLEATRNFHWAYVPPEGHWPTRKYYLNDITVLHPKYVPREFNDVPEHMGEIFLTPKE
jgi:hypothetical protein